MFPKRIKHRAAFRFVKPVDDLPRRIGFERPHFSAQIVGCRYQVEMILHDDIGVQREAAFPLKIAERIENDPGGRWMGEDGQPSNDRSGEEVGLVDFVNLVAASSHCRQ